MNVQDFGELFDNREVEDTRYDAVMTAPLFKEMILNCRLVNIELFKVNFLFLLFWVFWKKNFFMVIENFSSEK